MKIGDIVLVPCQIIDMGTLAYTGSPVLDLLPIEQSTGKHYTSNVVHVFSVLESDVILKEEG